MVRKTVTYPPPHRISIGGRPHTVAVRPDLTLDGVIPWVVEVDDGCYQVGDYNAIDLDSPREATRFLQLKLRGDDAPRGPAWLADIYSPLILLVGDSVVRCRTGISPESQQPIWLFEHEGSSSGGGPARTDDTVDRVRELATEWLG